MFVQRGFDRRLIEARIDRGALHYIGIEDFTDFDQSAGGRGLRIKSCSQNASREGRYSEGNCARGPHHCCIQEIQAS